MNVAECNKNHSNVIKMPEKKYNIPYEYFDAVARIRIPGEQMQILSFIVRKTWCWGKDEDRIATSQIVEVTGLKKQNVFRAIQSLKTKNIISVIKNDDKAMHTIRINTDFNSWELSSKKITSSNLIQGVIKNDDKASSKVMDTKEVFKETITKEIKNLSSDFCKSGAEKSVQDQISIFENLKNITLEEIEASIPQETKSTPPAEKPKAEKSKKETCLNKTQAEMFADFWGTYPKHRRKEKPKAEKAFKFINPDETLFAEIMAGLGAAINSNDWQKENGQFVCYPERFLKNKKWMDEYDNGKGFRKSGCPMTNYMPPKDLEAEAEKYANLLPEEPEF